MRLLRRQHRFEFRQGANYLNSLQVEPKVRLLLVSWQAINAGKR
jgi:hypothetical protein